MKQVKIDTLLIEKLGGLDRPVELRSEDGRTVGRYLPEAEYQQMLYAAVEIPYADEEIARRRAERGGCALEEIWKRVGQR